MAARYAWKAFQVEDGVYPRGTKMWVQRVSMASAENYKGSDQKLVQKLAVAKLWKSSYCMLKTIESQ